MSEEHNLFRFYKGVRLPYKKQGLIYFVCANYKKLPKETQDKILNLCLLIGGGDYQALFFLLTDTAQKIADIAKEYDVGQKKLCNLRKHFYEEWDSYKKCEQNSWNKASL